MKNLITIMILFVAFGCGKSEVETKIKSDIEKLEAANKRLEAELKEKQSELEAEQNEKKRKSDAEAKNKKLKEDLLKLSVVGKYKHKGEGGHSGIGDIIEIFDDGTLKMGDWDHWKFYQNEMYIFGRKEDPCIARIEANGDLVLLVEILGTGVGRSPFSETGGLRKNLRRRILDKRERLKYVWGKLSAK